VESPSRSANLPQTSYWKENLMLPETFKDQVLNAVYGTRCLAAFCAHIHASFGPHTRRSEPIDTQSLERALQIISQHADNWLEVSEAIRTVRTSYADALRELLFATATEIQFELVKRSRTSAAAKQLQIKVRLALTNAADSRPGMLSIGFIEALTTELVKQGVKSE
jgi:hypothetical protein